LRAFEAAARHGSFQRAAAELHVTAAAVSQQVKALEAELGVVLFYRQPRGLILSEAGRNLRPGVTRAFDGLAQATQQCRSGLPSGPLKISVLPSFASGWLIRRLPDFRALYPEIELVIDADTRFADLTAGDIDLAIRYSLGQFHDLQSHLLLREEIFPVCAPQLLHDRAPLRSLMDLTQHGLLHALTPTPNEPRVHWQPWLEEASIDPSSLKPGLAFTDSTHLYQAAMLGQGVALGRSGLIADDLIAGRLMRPLEIAVPANHAYYLVWYGAAEPPAKSSAFIDWCLQQAAMGLTN
jgi:LysR family glycine cleavage system transcriptional activator